MILAATREHEPLARAALRANLVAAASVATRACVGRSWALDMFHPAKVVGLG